MRAVFEFLRRLETVLAGTLLMLMVGLIFAGGIGRVLHHPINWTIDLATCCFAWTCFLCGDIAWRNGNLMAVEILTARLSPAARRAVAYLNYAIIAAFLVYLIHSGISLAWISRARAFQGIPGVSYSWVTMSLPVGGALLLFTTLRKIWVLRGQPLDAAAAKGAEPC